MEERFKSIEAENYSLRAYIISLQSRLIESQGEEAVPPPPGHLMAQQPSQQPAQIPPPQAPAVPQQALPQPAPAQTLEEKQAALKAAQAQRVAAAISDAASAAFAATMGGTKRGIAPAEEEAYNAFLAKRLKNGDAVVPPKTT